MTDLQLQHFLTWPLRAQLIVVLFIALLLLLAGYSVTIRPTTLSIKQNHRRISQGRAHLHSKHLMIEQLRAKIAALTAVKLQHNAGVLQLHKKITLAHVLAVLARLQARYHIQLIAEQPLRSKKIMGLTRFAVKLAVKGRFGDIKSFVFHMARLSWLCAVSELTLRRMTVRQHYVRMDMLFNVYTRRVN